MAHVIEQGQYFLFRTKDIHSKGLVHNFDFPEEDSFDITVKVTLVRSHSRKITVSDGYKRFVDKATAFDYIEYGSRGTYGLSFCKLKYTIGLNNFHSYKPEYIKQEIWARLTAYNITETLISHTVIETHDTKYNYQVNFAAAAHICRAFLRCPAEKGRIDVMSLLEKELLPIRKGRHYGQLKTAHFRKPRYFIYRAS